MSESYIKRVKNEQIENNMEAELDGDESLKASLSSEENGYPMYNIKVERGFYTVYELKRKYDGKVKRIILDSDFQREDVWKPLQKAELIESILMGLPLPIFYFNQDKMGRLIVVDGRQRLTALFEYMDDLWALKGLRVLKELNGKKFSMLDPIVQSQIEDYQIQAHVIQPPTSDRIKFDIFDRVNRAGTQLNKQEIRNALYQGKATELLNRIVKSEIFKIATEGAFINNSRMKDKYIVIRFIAFLLYFDKKIMADNKPYIYKNDIDELLGLTMETLNGMSEKGIASLENITLVSLERTVELLGENAFRMERANGTRSPINMNVFEVVMYFMSKLSPVMIKQKKKILCKVQNLKKDAEFQEAIGNHRDNWNKVEKRFGMIDSLLKELGE